MAVDEWTMDSEWTFEPEYSVEPATTATSEEDDITREEDGDDPCSIGVLLTRDGEPSLAEWFVDWD